MSVNIDGLREKFEAALRNGRLSSDLSNELVPQIEKIFQHPDFISLQVEHGYKVLHTFTSVEQFNLEIPAILEKYSVLDLKFIGSIEVKPTPVLDHINIYSMSEILKKGNVFV